MAYELETHLTDVDPAAYYAQLPTERRRAEGARRLLHQLIELGWRGSGTP
ncbi:hypothetical protein [Propioniciclava soli]|nr:hypothetical protein [Propioniciclava soli]